MFSLLIKSLFFYRKKYIWTLAGLVLAAAILSGALSVGSSVRYSLQTIASQRLGKVELMIDARLNPVSERLATSLAEDLELAPVLMMMGSANFEDLQVSNVFINGINHQFQNFFPDTPKNLSNKIAYISANVAKRLKIKTGQELVLRVRNHSLLPGDLPLTGSSDEYIGLRLAVEVLADKNLMSRFSLLAGQSPALNIFVDLAMLQSEINMKGLINEILIKDSTSLEVNQHLAKSWLPQDSNMTLRQVDSGSAHELISTRVFLPEEIVHTANSTRILTYMANEISHGDKKTPYSIVSGLDFQKKSGQVYEHLGELQAGEVILNTWTAEDLSAVVGDTISLKYYVDNEDGKLREDTANFVVKGIVEPEKLDRQLMPSYPGIAEEEHCRDWEPGIPMDMTQIRDKDEKYWEKYKGTPKLIVTYEDARELWGNRFGQTTSVRWPITQDKAEILAELKVGGAQKSGLSVIDIQAQAEAAAAQGIDFGMLFASMSFFIIVAALLMSGLLLGFQLEDRKAEMGLMLAAGFTGKDVRKRFLREGLLLSLVALVPGLPLGLFYTQQIIKLLSTIWIDAVGTSDIEMHVDAVVLISASLSFMVFAALTIWLVVKKITRRPVIDLLNDIQSGPDSQKRSFKTFYLGFLLLFVGVVTVLVGSDSMFAIASSLLLLAMLFLTHGLLRVLRFRQSSQKLSFLNLAICNMSRQSGRSLGAFILMACGAYLVLNTVARQKSFNLDKSAKSSGTGGFEYFAQTSVPLRYKPDSPEGMDEYFLDKNELAKLSVVSVRLHRGDDASCLNLNRAQNPQVYGISTKEMEGRFELSGEWSSLNQEQDDGTVPVIGDENTILWGLGLYTGVGSIFESVDEQGRAVRFKVVALLKNSILQGALLVNRRNFDRLYPAESGYSLFMIDVPSADYGIQEQLLGNFTDFGVELEDSGDRLRNFLKIESTYLVIFQMLGGLGLMLGAFGFGFLILRNVQDRAGELATMQALGFKIKDLRSLLFKEHVILLLWSVICGAGCALISWVPLLKQGADLPFGRVIVILALILLVGIASCLISVGSVFKGSFLNILKSE